MSVQSWQTTSSGMAVAVYQPASADCLGDGDDDEVTCEIDLQDLESLYSEAAEGVLEALIDAIAQYGSDYGLTDQNKVEHFLAQAAHETAGPPGEWDEFYSLEEFLDYDTAEEIAGTFDSFFGDEGQPDPADYVNDPEKLANYVYGNNDDLGNGPPESGDGYKYRGRGFFQLTGKYNYQEFSTYYEENHNPDAENQDFVEIPDLVLSPVIAAMSALWYFETYVIPDIEGEWTVESVSAAVAGSEEGLEDREHRYDEIAANITISCE